MDELLDDAAVDEAQERRIEREFAREYTLITDKDRLNTIAKDIVGHFLGRGQRGKAMVVSIDKATALRMYTLVQQHWQARIAEVQARLAGAKEPERAMLAEQLAYMQATDMAVIVSQGQNEIADMQKLGLDMAPHRRRMLAENLDEKFKNSDNPLRLVFVCAMWMTGFDVPACSTIYLDKPMRNHTLMQTIARANRVFRDKVNGLIVDYIGVFRNLQRALAIYATGNQAGDEAMPVKEKGALIARVREAVEEATEFCAAQGIDLTTLAAARGFARVGLMDHAEDALVTSVGSSTITRFSSLSCSAVPVKLYEPVITVRSSITLWCRM